MKLSRTQLIAWYTGKPEVEGEYLVKRRGETYIAHWEELGHDSGPVWVSADYTFKDTMEDDEEVDVDEWTPLP